MSRDTLHDLVDRIPEEELPTAKRFLEYLAISPAYRAALSAPIDDEPVTEGDVAAMARALATEPAVLLIDELSMGLAPIIVEELYDHVRRIAASGLSILIVEQFAHEILGLADRAGIMLHGRLLHTGPPANIAGELSDAYLGADHTAPVVDPSR